MSQDENDFRVNVGLDDDFGAAAVADDDATEGAAGEALDVDRDGDGEDAAAADASGEVTSTGEYRVDVALTRLQELPGLPVGDHVAVFDDVHAQLQAALADLDEH